MNAYYSGLITNEEVIKELLKAAEEIANFIRRVRISDCLMKKWRSMMP